LSAYLVIQQKERRQFDEGEEAFLVTMSAQLAGVIAHAEATGSIRGLGRQGKGIQEAKFVGVPGSPGAAVGTAVVMLPPGRPGRGAGQVRRPTSTAEIKLFKTALEGVRADMRNRVEKAGHATAPRRTGAVRRVPDDARRRVTGQRSQDRDQDRPVGPGRAASGGHRSRQPLSN
jgi:signal transduction protein with GAF and PtsI domain